MTKKERRKLMSKQFQPGFTVRDMKDKISKRIGKPITNKEFLDILLRIQEE